MELGEGNIAIVFTMSTLEGFSSILLDPRQLNIASYTEISTVFAHVPLSSVSGFQEKLLYQKKGPHVHNIFTLISEYNGISTMLPLH